MGLGQYDGLGEYCGPHNAFSLFFSFFLNLLFLNILRDLLWSSYATDFSRMFRVSCIND